MFAFISFLIVLGIQYHILTRLGHLENQLAQYEEVAQKLGSVLLRQGELIDDIMAVIRRP